MPLETVKEFPYDFHGFKLLRRLGGGFMSEAYLAEVPQDILDIPRHICLKIFTDKTDVYTEHYTVQSATVEFIFQRQVLRDIQHPFLVKGFPDVLPEVKDCVPTELGLCTLEDLQASLGEETGPRSNHFHPIAVRYFAAQLFLAVTHLHSKGIYWEDSKQSNVIIQSDFTLRIIDVGTFEKQCDSGIRDHFFLAGSLYNMSTTSSEGVMYRDLTYYQNLFKKLEQELDPIFQDMLYSMLKLETFSSLLDHSYWTTVIDGDSDTAVDLLAIHNSDDEVAHLSKLRNLAWATLPTKAQDWIINLGLEVRSF